MVWQQHSNCAPSEYERVLVRLGWYGLVRTQVIVLTVALRGINYSER